MLLFLSGLLFGLAAGFILAAFFEGGTQMFWVGLLAGIPTGLLLIVGFLLVALPSEKVLREEINRRRV